MATAELTDVKSVTVTIDGREVTVPEDTTIWEAAKQIGIEIPVLCHSERMNPVGVCRMCVVDVGERVLAAACVRECQHEQNVEASSEKVEKHRAMLTRLLLSDHPTPCERERTTGDCELEELGRHYGLIDQSGDLLGGRGSRRAEMKGASRLLKKVSDPLEGVKNKP